MASTRSISGAFIRLPIDFAFCLTVITASHRQIFHLMTSPRFLLFLSNAPSTLRFFRLQRNCCLPGLFTGPNRCGVVAVLEVEAVRISCAKGSSSVASNLRDGASWLPVSSADDACAISVGTVELVTTSSEIVEGIVEGPLTITGLPALGLVDNRLKSLGAITTT